MQDNKRMGVQSAPHSTAHQREKIQKYFGQEILLLGATVNRPSGEREFP